MYTARPILLIEDDPIDQKAVQMAFNELKITNKLIILANGEEGVEYLKNNERPCLVILDLNMPFMDGFEFLDVVKNTKESEKFRNVPIIVFTSSNEENEKIKAYNRCVVGYIVKPLDYRKFVDLFKTVDLYWTISQGAPK